MEEFRISIDTAALDDLHRRIDATRWIAPVLARDWSLGTDQAYLRSLADYWRHGFDWRAQEARINAYPQYLARGADQTLHLLWAKGRRPDSIPLVLLHGWPSSFVQMLDLIPLLTHPTRPGVPSFDVVIISLPGFGFSSAPDRPEMNERDAASAIHDVVTRELGYPRFVVRGSDFGQGVLDAIVADHPESVIAAHISGTSATTEPLPFDASPSERRYVEEVARWRERESGYSVQQQTRPDSLSPSLNDSPVGLAAWIVEKFRRWSDCDGDIEKRFTKDELLTNISLYWFTGSIASSIRWYAAPAPSISVRDSPVPIAFLMSPKDMVPTPREWVERSYRLARWTEIDRGGHFLDWEEPRLVAEDIQTFVGGLGSEGTDG